jgi:hypothetical protein
MKTWTVVPQKKPCIVLRIFASTLLVGHLPIPGRTIGGDAALRIREVQGGEVVPVTDWRDALMLVAEKQ